MKHLSIVCTALFALTVTAKGQTITTIAGTGAMGYTGDGAAATAAHLYHPAHPVADCSGNIFFTDYNNNAIRKIDATGVISTIAGNGTAGYSGDGGAATAALLRSPNCMVMDNAGNLFFADQGNHVIRKISAGGVITTVAGNGTPGFSGDGGQATAAQLSSASGINVDRYGNLIIAEYINQRIRRVNTSGIITTIVGTGIAGFSGDGGPATAAQIHQPTDVAIDTTGNLYVCDQLNNRIRKVDTSGIIMTVIGTGAMAYMGDGGPATAASLHYPAMTRIDRAGNIILDDSYNNVIRLVDPSGVINTIIGTGTAGYTGDGGSATAATLNQPWGFTLDDCQNLIIADAMNNVLRKVAYNVMPSLTGGTSLAVGASIQLTSSADCGAWTSSSPGIATIGSGTGIVTGVTSGTAVITYTNYCGSSTRSVTVNTTTSANELSGVPYHVSVAPNPVQDAFTLTTPEAGQFSLWSVDGRSVITYTVGKGETPLMLPRNLGVGMYIGRFTGSTGAMVVLRIVRQP